MASIINSLNKFSSCRLFISKYNLYKDYLKKEGWHKSVKKRMSIDNNGNPIPWFNYNIIKFLTERINNNHSVFEYGSGNSTLWFSENAKNVVSVEHNPQWYNLMKDKLNAKSNVEYIFKELANYEYAGAINNQSQEFNIVIVDGRDRVECAKNAVKKLSANGIVIWDNADRSEYNEGYELLKSEGFKRIDFYGITPIVHFDCCTAIFYKSDNCLGI